MDSTLSQLLQRIVFLETMADALQRRANELEGMNAALEAERDEALAKADPTATITEASFKWPENLRALR